MRCINLPPLQQQGQHRAKNHRRADDQEEARRDRKGVDDVRLECDDTHKPGYHEQARQSNRACCLVRDDAACPLRGVRGDFASRQATDNANRRLSTGDTEATALGSRQLKQRQRRGQCSLRLIRLT